MIKICYVSYRNSMTGTEEVVKNYYTEKGAEEESLGNSNSYTAGNPKIENIESLSRNQVV